MLDKFDHSRHNALMSYLQSAQNADVPYFVRSYAKINLTLDVVGRREDGFHELITLMQTVDLYDTLCLTPLAENRVQMICTKPELATENNLAARAADMIRQRFSLTKGLKIELQKQVPMAAGLGGGSSNAAAVLLALKDLWQLPLTPTELLDMAATLGSDVPFFLNGGLALCEGRGERVTPVTAHWPASLRWLIVLKPAIGISTANVFRALPPQDYTDGSHSRAVLSALQNGQEPALEHLHNGLERGVLELYGEVNRAREEMLQSGAAYVRLSGSGPSLFAPFADLEQAAHTRQQLAQKGYEVYLTRAI